MSGGDPELLTLVLSLPGILGYKICDLALDWMVLNLFWKVREEHATSIKYLLHARREPRQCYPFSLLAMTREGLLAPLYRSNMEALQPRETSWLKVRRVWLSHCWDLFFFLFQSFKNISKYFSKKEWARLGYSEKITYVNLKRNYETMTRLGNRKFWVQKRLGINDDSSLQAIFFLGYAKCPTFVLFCVKKPHGRFQAFCSLKSCAGLWTESGPRDAQTWILCISLSLAMVQIPPAQLRSFTVGAVSQHFPLLSGCLLRNKYFASFQVSSVPYQLSCVLKMEPQNPSIVILKLRTPGKRVSDRK